MAYASYEVLAEADVEVGENTQIKIQMSKHMGTGAISLSLNKRFKKGDDPKWQWGKGFMIPEEFTTEFLQKVGEVMGLEVHLDL